MTTVSVSSNVMNPVDAIFQVFNDATHPLTLAQAQKLYTGAKLAKGQMAQIIEEELLMTGRLFRCSPSGKSARYWAFDEEEQLREQITQILSGGSLSESKIVDLVNKALPKVSSKPVIKTRLAEMQREGILHRWPGKGAAKNLALDPFDPLTLIVFKTTTLKDLSTLLTKVEPLGVSVEQFVELLRRALRPSERVGTPHVEESAAKRTTAASSLPTPQCVGETPRLIELESLILKGMSDLDPAVDSGATVLIRDLRRHLPHDYRKPELFDTTVMRLAEEGKVVLHRHDQPIILTPEERSELVRDPATGTYFTSIAHRV